MEKKELKIDEWNLIYLKWSHCYRWMFLGSLNASKDELKMELLEFKYHQKVNGSSENRTFQPADRYIYKLSSIRPTDPGDVRLFADPILIRNRLHVALLLNCRGTAVFAVWKPKIDTEQVAEFRILIEEQIEDRRVPEMAVSSKGLIAINSNGGLSIVYLNEGVFQKISERGHINLLWSPDSLILLSTEVHYISMFLFDNPVDHGIFTDSSY